MRTLILALCSLALAACSRHGDEARPTPSATPSLREVSERQQQAMANALAKRKTDQGGKATASPLATTPP